MPRLTAEIELDSPFGRALTEQALKSCLIVEVGTGSGLGSTQCLLAGMGGFHQSLLTFEGDEVQHGVARNNIHSERTHVNVIHGILHQTIRPYFHPINSAQDREAWSFEHSLMLLSPVKEVFHNFDLCLLDGGEFSSDGDFLALWDRCKVIALDDCNPLKSVKNCYAFNCLMRAGWERLYVVLEDRNGWAIFKRP
jgi:hypothetical protein